MSQKHWLVLFALIGILFCVSYLYLANKFCPVEQSSLNLNWRLTPDLNKKEKHDRAAYRYGRQKNKGHYVSAAFPTAYTLSQKPESGKDADHAESKGHVWLTKFFCDAKLSDLLIALFTYGLFLATGWLVWATLKLWKAGDEQLKFVRESSAEQAANMLASIDASRKSADAAMKAAETAEKSLILEQRPWLRWNVAPLIKLVADSKRITATVDVVFENVGKTPAMNVAYTAKLYTRRRPEPTVTVGILHLNDMSAAYKEGPLVVTSIMPDEKTTPPLRYGPSISIDDLNPSEIGQFHLYLAIHAGYRLFDGGKVAEIGSLYMLRAIGPTPLPGGGHQVSKDGIDFSLALIKERPEMQAVFMELPSSRCVT
jgi:hypothetical protein